MSTTSLSIKTVKILKLKKKDVREKLEISYTAIYAKYVCEYL